MIITKDDSSLVSKCNLSELVSDYYAIYSYVESIKPIPPKKLITYGKLIRLT